MDGFDFNLEGGSAFSLTELPKTSVLQPKRKNSSDEEKIIPEGRKPKLPPIKKVYKKVTDEELLAMSPSLYKTLSFGQLSRLSNLKNTNLLKLNEENEVSKKTLTRLIKTLEKLISQNAELFQDEEENEILRRKLERLLEVRNKDLDMSKKSNNTIKKQYRALMKRYNDNENFEINTVQQSIEEYKQKNKELIQEIYEETLQTKKNKEEIEKLKHTRSKKQLKQYTNEINNLSVFKYDYYKKLALNKKSLKNEKKELLQLEDMLNKINEQTNTNNNIVIAKQKVNEWVKKLKEDLTGTEEEIFKRCEEGKSQVVKMYEEMARQKMLRARSTSPDSTPSVSVASQNVNMSCGGVGMKVNTSRTRGRNVYNLFGAKVALRKPNILPRSESDFEPKGKDLSELYKEMTNEDYKDLMMKKKEYFIQNFRLEKGLKENIKVKNSKITKMTENIKNNQMILDNLIKENEILTDEIKKLEKIEELSIEQMKLKKKLKKDEEEKSKIINDISGVGGKILNPLSDTEDNKIFSSGEQSQIDVKQSKNHSENEAEEPVMTRNERLIKIRKKYLEGEEKEVDEKSENYSNE